jgi:hypothetical protein
MGTITYSASSVTLEGAAMDLHIGKPHCKNSSAGLEVACGPPGIGAKKVQEISENTLYILTSVAVLLSNVLS